MTTDVMKPYRDGTFAIDAATRNFVRHIVRNMGQEPLPEVTVERIARKIRKEFDFLSSSNETEAKQS